jgi:hypothetical protein
MFNEGGGGGVRTCVHFLSGVEGPILRSAEYAMRAHVIVLAQDRKNCKQPWEPKAWDSVRNTSDQH